MASRKKQSPQKPSFPILPLALGAGVLAGLYLLARRSNPQLEAARRQEAAINAALGNTRTTGIIDLSKLTRGRLFIVGSEVDPNNPFAGQYTVLTDKGVQNGTIHAKSLNVQHAKPLAEMTPADLAAEEEDVPVARITAIRGV